MSRYELLFIVLFPSTYTILEILELASKYDKQGFETWIVHFCSEQPSCIEIYHLVP